MRFLLAITGLAAWLLSAAPSPAQNCGTVVRHRVVQQHVAHAAHVAVVHQPAVIATFAAVPVAVPHYSVGFDPHGGELAELRKTIKELSKTIEILGRSGPGVAPKDAPSDDVSGKAWQVLSKHCASCHTGAQAQGKVTIFTEPGKPNPSVDLFLLWEAADSGRMPKGTQPIADAEVTALRALVALAAKQRRAAQQK